MAHRPAKARRLEAIFKNDLREQFLNGYTAYLSRIRVLMARMRGRFGRNRINFWLFWSIHTLSKPSAEGNPAIPDVYLHIGETDAKSANVEFFDTAHLRWITENKSDWHHGLSENVEQMSLLLIVMGRS